MKITDEEPEFATLLGLWLHCLDNDILLKYEDVSGLKIDKLGSVKNI